MEWILFLTSLLVDESKHFGLSLLMGSLGFYWTATIFCVSSWVWVTLTSKKMNTAVGYCMLIMCLLAGIALGLFSHAWLDGFSLWYSTPSGPPLNLHLNPSG
jgi:hypothetical protein